MTTTTPKKKGGRQTKHLSALTLKKAPEKWRAVFVAAIGKSMNVTSAARAAGVTRQAAYLARKTDADFAAAWDEALAEAIESAEGEMYRRAVEGTTKPVYQNGEHVGDVQEYSDTLLIFMLKAHRPALYRDRLQVETMQADLSRLTDEQLERLTKGESLNTVLAIAGGGRAGTAPPPAGDPAG